MIYMYNIYVCNLRQHTFSATPVGTRSPFAFDHSVDVKEKLYLVEKRDLARLFINLMIIRWMAGDLFPWSKKILIF